MDTYTPEHERVAAIIAVCKNKLDRDILRAFKGHRDAQRIIHEMVVDFAVMYRDIDPSFDFARFLREASRKEE